MITIPQIIFLVVAALTVLFAVLVVTQRNLVHASLWLIATLFAVAVIFVLLEASFIAVVQVVLYIGAIAILIIFAMMLTRKVMNEDVPQTLGHWPISLVVSAAFFIGFAGLLGTHNWADGSAFDASGTIAQLGRSFTDPNQYVLPFQIAGVLLTIALIGAIAVAADTKANS